MKKSSANKIRVLLVDDHAMFRAGLKTVLEYVSDRIKIIGAVENGQKAVEFCKKNVVDIVLMDIEMPVMDGIEATKKILSSNPNQNILMLTMHDEPQTIQECITNGVKGYLLKNDEVSELVNAIEAVVDTGYYFDDRVSRVLITMLVEKNKKVALTETEIEVIKLICDEHTNSEIAAKLDVSLRTIDTYRQRILEKTKAKNTAGIVMYAIKNKLLD